MGSGFSRTVTRSFRFSRTIWYVVSGFSRTWATIVKTPLSAIMSEPLSRIESGGMTAAELGRILSQFVSRPVIDRTGSTGYFAIRLEFASEADVSPPAPSVAGVPTNSSVGSDVPSVFAALQEQMGLKLEPRREQTEVLVIDNVEQPTPD